MAKPILSNITVFDASSDATIPFLYYGKITLITYYVYDNETGEQVATGTASPIGTLAEKSFNFPAHKLTNKAFPYFMKIKITYNSEDSELSDPVLFYCHAKPSLEFAKLSTSTPNQISTSSYQFELNYINDSSQGESLNTYQYHLYDSDKNILVESNVYYGDIANTFIVDGFSNNGIYYIRGTGTSVNGYEFDTGYLSLSVSYTVELNRTLLNVVNDANEGVMRVNSTIAFMDGVSIGEIQYIKLGYNNYGADLTDGSIAYTIPYELDAYSTNNYSIRITVKPIAYKNIIVITHATGNYNISSNIRTFTDYADETEKFFLILEGKDYVMESNYIDKPTEEDFVTLYIAFKNGLFSLYIKNVGSLSITESNK